MLPVATFLERQITAPGTVRLGEAGAFLILSVQLHSRDCSIVVTPKKLQPGTKPLHSAPSCPPTCSSVCKKREFPPKGGSDTHVSLAFTRIGRCCISTAKSIWPNVEAFNSVNCSGLPLARKHLFQRKNVSHLK